MDSRIKHLAHSQMGRKIKHAGAHMYHAATGVSDGRPTTETKNAKLKKAFARMRARSKDHYDEGTHSYLVSRDDAARESVY